MSLADESLRFKEVAPFTSCRAAISSQQKLRSEIEEQTKQFLLNGGQVEIKAIMPAKIIPIHFSNDVDNVSIEEMMARNKKRHSQRSTSGHMYIRPSGKDYTFLWDKTIRIRGTVEECVKFRNEYFNSRGIKIPD